MSSPESWSVSRRTLLLAGASSMIVGLIVGNHGSQQYREEVRSAMEALPGDCADAVGAYGMTLKIDEAFEFAERCKNVPIADLESVRAARGSENPLSAAGMGLGLAGTLAGAWAVARDPLTRIAREN